MKPKYEYIKSLPYGEESNTYETDDISWGMSKNVLLNWQIIFLILKF